LAVTKQNKFGHGDTPNLYFSKKLLAECVYIRLKKKKVLSLVGKGTGTEKKKRGRGLSRKVKIPRGFLY
jgi:hypothetical protein